MAKERLSKLQKWILMAALKNEGGLYRRDITRHYFGKATPSAEVSVTRSILGLIEKGYIEGRSFPTITGEQMMAGFVMTHENLTDADIKEFAQTLPPKKRFEFTINCKEDHGKKTIIKEVYLTPKGDKRATDLLNVKKRT